MGRNIITWIASGLYGAAVNIRNTMFEMKFLKTEDFQFPIISVGNITVGGTGKTPMIEYLITLLKDRFKLGVLSRGYGRKTNGYVKAVPNSTPRQIGDEMVQLNRKFPEVFKAVCEKRVKGMRIMDKDSDGLQVALLDDAYQHRYIGRDIDILLVDYNRPLFSDRMLPYGNLREPLYAQDRANIIIVTKCPRDITPMDRRIFVTRLNPRPYQSVYFTYQEYGALRPMFPETAEDCNVGDYQEAAVVSGIADPSSLEDYVRTLFNKILTHRLSDHFRYKEKSIREIENRFLKSKEKRRIIVTTEKDEVKISQYRSAMTRPELWYVLPVCIRFIHKEDEVKFQKKIISYLEKNQRNNLLHRS